MYYKIYSSLVITQIEYIVPTIENINPQFIKDSEYLRRKYYGTEQKNTNLQDIAEEMAGERRTHLAAGGTYKAE